MELTMQTRVVTAHIPIDLAEKVDALAERLERPRGWIVKKALAAWIDEEELRDRLTREAMEEARSGLGIDHEDVKAWADSLGGPNPLPLPTPKP
ncbi:MAG TPA: ribbon-helix-helix domain-containing protein [Caulobacteraceae bacterium]|nr:ribbon-helix-helix domain-containing protein [Caulobacteraceae bacterium]